MLRNHHTFYFQFLAFLWSNYPGPGPTVLDNKEKTFKTYANKGTGNYFMNLMKLYGPSPSTHPFYPFMLNQALIFSLTIQTMFDYLTFRGSYMSDESLLMECLTWFNKSWFGWVDTNDLISHLDYIFSKVVFLSSNLHSIHRSTLTVITDLFGHTNKNIWRLFRA